MELIGENEKCVASKCREVEGAAGTTVDNPSATEDVWEIVNHLLTSYNQQSKLKNSSSETSLQDFIANPSQNEGVRNDFPAQNESGKEKKIQELAQEFVQQTTPALQCPISEQLQVINEEDLAAVLPDVEGSGSLEGFVSLNTRNNDSPSTLIESLDGAYGGVSVALNLSGPVQISEGATAPPAPSNAQNPHQNGAHYSPLATTERAENISSSENTDLINPSAYKWLLKPSPGYECTPLSSETDLSEQKSPDSNFSSCRSLRSSVKRRQSQNLDSIHCDGEQSVKIDCSVSHVSLDSGFGGSPSYTSSPNSAYLYSPLSVETKSPSSRARGYELCFKRSQSSPEQNEKMDDTMQESLFTERESAGTSQHSKRKGGRSRKSSATRKPDICSLVEKLISIEERSKKVVKKSPHRERIKKVRRWLKSERKKKYKKAVVADSNVTTDVDKLITKFNSFTIVEKNPHLTRASNHIIKSKFSCKCCSDNDPDRPFSRSKNKKWSSRRKDTSSEQRTAKHLLLGKKKMKKNIDLRNEKYDRRLPLKKRLYRIAANSCTKTDSAGIATDVAQDINGKSISPTIPVPEANKEISCQLSSENREETRIIPVTPKKRFQNKRQNMPDSETFSISPPLRKGSQCNDMIPHSQIQVDLSTCKQTLQVKLSKISDEICKKMKSVTLLPSNDLKVSSSSSKDLSKVSKHRRNIPSTEQSNLNLEVKFDPIQNLTKDLNKCGTIDDTETCSPKTKEKQVSIPKADNDDNRSINQNDQATQFIRKTTSVSNDCHTVPIESVTSSKNRKKRKRTINRTGFPTKKKKKKSNTSNEANVKEKTMAAKPHIGSKDPVCHGETIVLTPLKTDKIKHFPSTSKFFPELSCFVENGSNLVNGQHVVPKSGEENVENVSFLGTTLHQQINPSTQNRRVSLRARPRQRRDSLLLAEANKKSCDKKTKHETRLQDFHELMERSKLIIAEKKYLEAGLFSDQFKVNDVEIDSCCEQKNCELDVSSLPSLSYYAERVRQKTDFTLPFDVWASHRAPKTLTRIKSNRNELSKECDDSGSGSDLNEDMSDTFDGNNPSFSFFLPRKLDAFGSEGQATTLLTDEQSKFIRANSCFLIRNLIKVQAIVVDKNNSASSNRGNELKLNIKSGTSTKKLETISQTLQSFQKLRETSKEINNIQQDSSMESKECNRNLLSEEKSKLKFENSASCNCSSQFVENHTSSRRTQSSRKLFSGNDANKSCSQILVSGTPETSIEVGLTQMGNGQKYFKALTSGDCIIQTGENVYITKDNSELKLDETVETSIFGRADCNVFHIERLWRDENNDGYAFGYYFLRPHETFHEPSRRFFPNELMKSPLCETIPISRIVGHCHVLNLSSYCREKPASADLDHIFICEYRVDKGAKTFSRIPKRKACFSSDETTEFHLPPLKPVRNFKPYDTTSNFRKIKKQHKTLKHTDTSEISGVHYVGGSHRSTSLANYSTDKIDEQTQQQQPHSITSKISRTEDYAF